ncbi:MAG: hypothetical protein MJ214_01255 [Bacilli bacterium]|nr:hypothetical protein [Bacilli bacterium]
MKKILFVMPLMAISLLASCGNNNPQKDEYTVTEQEMKDAFAMKDVEYLQFSITQEGEGYEEGLAIYEFTPTSYHHSNEWSDMYTEILVLKDGDNYSKYERHSKEEPFTPDTYKEGDFKTISEYVDEAFKKVREKEYSDFYYSEERKEYTTYSYTDIDVAVSLYQFLNKKLSKCIKISPILGKVVKENVTYTYDKIEPPSPTI